MIRPFNYPYPVNKIELSNGCNVAYIDEGKGEKTLLFIHGLATYSLSWQKNIEYLKKHYRCIAIDLPGNGLSDRGEYPYGINFFAGCVYDLITKLKLANVCIVAHSMGGQVAIKLLANQPECAEKLVLCAPAGFETFTPFEKTMYRSAIGFFDMFSTDEASLRNTIQTSFYHFRQEGSEMINELIELMKLYPVKAYRDMIDSCISSMLNEPIFADLPKIQQPTLVLFGDHDALIPNRLIHQVSTWQIAEQGAKQILTAQVIMIPKCGHFLQIEKAEEVNGYIQAFIE